MIYQTINIVIKIINIVSMEQCTSNITWKRNHLFSLTWIRRNMASCSSMQHNLHPYAKLFLFVLTENEYLLPILPRFQFWYVEFIINLGICLTCPLFPHLRTHLPHINFPLSNFPLTSLSLKSGCFGFIIKIFLCSHFILSRICSH